jgi:protease PrsW
LSDAIMLNNALPLLVTVASIAAGEPPPESEPLPDTGFLESFLSSSLLEIVLFLPFILMLALALWRSGVWERHVIREELADEVGRTISQDEYRDIVADRMLRTRRIDPARPATSAALVNGQHELAFRKRRVKDEGKNPDRDPLATGWRHEILQLRPLA